VDPVLAAVVVNGVDTPCRYRNYEEVDESRNILADRDLASAAKSSTTTTTPTQSPRARGSPVRVRRGWLYIRMLPVPHLAKVDYARD
jgi:hypothetical protein